MGAFTGKTVLILGGSRGIGAAIVRRFVTDGANVRFTYAGSKDAAERLAQETGATAVFTDSADRDAVIDVVRKSGALDILVVNAGIGVFGDALELKPTILIAFSKSIFMLLTMPLLKPPGRCPKAGAS